MLFQLYVILYHLHQYSVILKLIFFNITTPLYHKPISVVSSFNLTQILSEPTHVTSNIATLIIDLIFVSSTVQINACSTIPPLSNADHYAIQLSVKTKNYMEVQPG